MNKDKRNNIKLLGTLNNSDESGIIANANQIYDANEDKSTQDVSKEHTERIKTLEDKENSMQTTLENITKTGEASAASNVTYNHSDSKLDATNVQQAVDEISTKTVFDISAYHATDGTLATYDNLEDALGTDGKNIPQSLRKGGMSVKFVQSSDNKYVRFNYLLSSVIDADIANVNNWQGVISDLVDGSGDLITSGGVKSSIDLIFDYIIKINFTSSYQIKNLPSSIPAGTVVKNTSSFAIYLNGTTYLNSDNAVALSSDLTSITSGSVGECSLYVYSGKLDKIDKEIHGYDLNYTFSSTNQTIGIPTIPAGTKIKNNGQLGLYIYENTYLTSGNSIVLPNDLYALKSTIAGDYSIRVYTKTDVLQQEIDDVEQEIDDVEEIIKNPVGYQLRLPFTGYQEISIDTVPSGTRIKNNGTCGFYLNGQNLLNTGDEIILTYDLTSITGNGRTSGEMILLVYGEFTDYKAKLDLITGNTFTINYTSQYQSKYLPSVIPSGTRIKNVGTQGFYIYDSTWIGINQMVVLPSDLSAIKCSAVGDVKVEVYGEFTDYKAKLDLITGYTFTINYTSQYQSKSVLPVIKAGTTIKNVGTQGFYIYDSTWIERNQMVVLPSDLSAIKCSAVGDVKVEVYGELYDINNKIGKDISYTLTIKNYTSQYQSKDLPSVIPSGTRIKNVGTQGFYIYDSTWIERNQMVVLPSDLSAIKCSAVGDVKVEVYGEGYETILTNSPKIKGFSAKVFKRVGCIGDSYTAGYILTDEQNAHDYPEYAWPHFMSKLTGNEYVNFGVSGASAKSFVNTHFNSLHIGDANNKCQAYVIGLLINDAGDWNPDRVEPGTADDIGTDNNTYTAWYYKLVQMVVNANPLAKIFVNTEPRHGNDGYNTALKNIVDYCRNNNQNVYLCDLVLYRNSDFYLNPIFTQDAINGHYTGIGYEFMAECYIQIMSDVMHQYPSEFQNIYKIPFADNQN